MQWTIDCDNVTLTQHLLQALHTPAADLLFDLRFERLIIKVEQFLAFEWLQPPEHALADAANSNGAHHLAFKIVLVLSDPSDIPSACLDLLMGGDEIANESQDCHEDVLGDGNDIGACDFRNGDTAIGLVRGIEINMIGSDTCRNGKLELLGFFETLLGQVAGVEPRIQGKILS